MVEEDGSQTQATASLSKRAFKMYWEFGRSTIDTLEASSARVAVVKASMDFGKGAGESLGWVQSGALWRFRWSLIDPRIVCWKDRETRDRDVRRARWSF